VPMIRPFIKKVTARVVSLKEIVFMEASPDRTLVIRDFGALMRSSDAAGSSLKGTGLSLRSWLVAYNDGTSNRTKRQSRDGESNAETQAQARHQIATACL
jgi:hypothetical protein